MVLDEARRVTALIDHFRSRAVRTTLPCGRTSTSPCQVSIDAGSWRNSRLVRACEGVIMVVRDPDLTGDASEKQGALLPHPRRESR